MLIAFFLRLSCMYVPPDLVSVKLRNQKVGSAGFISTDLVCFVCGDDEIFAPNCGVKPIG